VGLDAICLLLASWIAWALVEPNLSANHYAGVTAGGVFLTFLALFSCDAYRPSVIGNGQRTFAAIRNAMGIAFAVAIAFYYAVTVPAGAVDCLVRTATFYFPLLLLERAAFRAVCTLPRFSRRVVILGTSSLGSEIARTLCQQQNAGIELVGFLSDELAYDHPGASFYECKVIGEIHHLEKILDLTRIDHIVVATTGRSDHFPRDILQVAKMGGCRVESGVSFLERLAGKIYLRDLHPGYLIFSDGFRTSRLGAVAKRAVDIVLAALAAIVIAPVMGLCALAIKLESDGPVLFRQVRLGLGNQRFVMYKLRSMRENAEAETGAVFTAEGDERITRVGHFIRRTRLDEFPQLWNILRGEMTLVGPRAERPEFFDSLGERYVYYRLRSSVKPGLTGWAQTRYGYVNDVSAYEEKLALDLYYLKHRSLTMDLVILWNTIKTVLLARGM
jgi:exopolysaccharide biosynthesis polyprenyl glycosylphosphotransferase